MSKLLRHFKTGDMCFITNVTHNRAPVLIENADLFWQSMKNVQDKLTFELVAWVLLPDHFHIIIESKDVSPSDIMQRLKLSFGSYYRKCQGAKSGRVWQRQYWDHIIRDQNDLNNHIDYIHYNPVKHAMVNDPFRYEHSSASVFLQDGYYSSDWGVSKVLTFDGDFGEVYRIGGVAEN